MRKFKRGSKSSKVSRKNTPKPSGKSKSVSPISDMKTRLASPKVITSEKNSNDEKKQTVDSVEEAKAAFLQDVAQSAANLAKSDQAPKRRGRPPKSASNPSQPAPASVSDSNGSATSGQQPSGATGEPRAPSIAARGIVRTGFKGMASVTGWNGWELERDEEQALAGSLTETGDAFFPGLATSKYGRLAELLVLTATIIGQRYFDYVRLLNAPPSYDEAEHESRRPKEPMPMKQPAQFDGEVSGELVLPPAV